MVETMTLEASIGWFAQSAGVAHGQRLAPSGETVLDYDRQHLALYAALIDADDTGRDWREAAAMFMLIDVTTPWAEACWRSHLERARWIVGHGLEAAITAFGEKSRQSD